MIYQGNKGNKGNKARLRPYIIPIIQKCSDRIKADVAVEKLFIRTKRLNNC